LAELLCCDCVFCNSLVFYVSTFYFILWAVVSAGYSALLSSSHFERINNDDDDDNLTIMPKLRSTYDGRLIYQTSYEGRKAFIRYDSLAKL